MAASAQGGSQQDMDRLEAMGLIGAHSYGLLAALNVTD